MGETLSVLARGGLLVLDIEYAYAAPTKGQRAYVGRASRRAWKEADLPKDCPSHVHSNEFLEPGAKHIPHVAYPRKDNPTEVPASNYYRKQVKKGALWAADAATARECGAKFDPTFGGDYPNLVKAARKRGKDGNE